MSSIRYLTLLLIAALTVQATPSLKVSLSGDGHVSGVDAFTVRAVIQNTGDEDLVLYNEPQGVLNTIPTKSFKFAKSTSHDAPEFIGPIVKYSFDYATSFTNLAAGESITVDHELGRAFAFTSGGTYSIEPSTKFYFKDPTDGTPIAIEAELERTHAVKLSGTLSSRWIEKRRAHYEELQIRNEKRAELGKRQTQFANCSSTQEGVIQQSAYVASLYVADAEKYLTLNAAGTNRFVEWFGDYNSGHHSTVLSHYTNIRTSDVKTYTFDCACEEGDDIFAYVFPDEIGHVYLCNQYMIAEIEGTDSKAGTIVHESTHFTLNAGTLDISYGQPGARQLAQTNSTGAIMNADSHEYFAENNPWLT